MPSIIASVSHQRRGHRGFTLIELLVVIAIIALLISILLPSLEAARKQSKQVACLAHIKNIASSSRVYESEDPNGWGIPAHHLQFLQDPDNPTFIGAYEWGGKSGIGAEGFVPGAGGEYAFLTSKYGTKAGFGPGTRAMNAILYPGGFKDNLLPSFDRKGATQDTKLDLGIFRCPGDDGPPRAAHCPSWVEHSERSSYDHFGNSYAANTFMVRSTGGDGCVQSNSPYLRPTSRVPTPSRTLYYEENIGRYAWTCRRERCDISDIPPGTGLGPTKSLRGWHGKDWTYNRAFVDAHAEYQKVQIEGTEDQQGYYHHYNQERLESYPAYNGGCSSNYSSGGTLEDQFQIFHCVIIRGPGWQKDTLPAPLIDTSIKNSKNPGRGSYEACAGHETWPD